VTAIWCVERTPRKTFLNSQQLAAKKNLALSHLSVVTKSLVFFFRYLTAR
jgi:hypothetical protein